MLPNFKPHPPPLHTQPLLHSNCECRGTAQKGTPPATYAATTLTLHGTPSTLWKHPTLTERRKRRVRGTGGRVNKGTKQRVVCVNSVHCRTAASVGPQAGGQVNFEKGMKHMHRLLLGPPPWCHPSSVAPRRVTKGPAPTRWHSLLGRPHQPATAGPQPSHAGCQTATHSHIHPHAGGVQTLMKLSFRWSGPQPPSQCRRLAGTQRTARAQHANSATCPCPP